MKYVFLAAFIAFTAVHLYASLKCNRLLRAVTKIFLLPMLLGWYLTSTNQPQSIVIAAVATSWLGDVLLIGGPVGFAVGGTSFFISHLCFAAAYCIGLNFALVPVWVIVLAPIVYLAAVVLVFRGLRGYISNGLFVSMAGYLVINGAMNCFALFRLIADPCLATVLTFIGAVSFFASDYILFYVRFKKNGFFKTHFMVMLTYLLAEFLIVEGFLLAL